MSALLSLQGVKKSYRLGDTEVHALKGVSAELEGGQATALVGRSGSGKSTLLHVAGLIDQPAEGTIRFDGQKLLELTDDERSDFRRDTFGFIFQSYHLVPVFSVLENVTLPAAFRGNAAGARGRGLELLERVGLKDYAFRNVKALSGGQRQRVAIARSLINSPRFVFADEPTANLDAESGDKVIELLFSLCRDAKVGLLIATHDMALAARAETTIQMKDGVRV